MAGKSATSNAPWAFLNYIYFDAEMNYVSAGFKQISTAALGVGIHENIALNDIIPDREGYILAYLSNENAEAVNIHFDDFTIYQGKSRIKGADDYYPFGLTFNSYTSGTENKYLFQGQEHQDETGWDSFKWRNHDPALGRFFNIDPLAEDYYYNSPYAFSENDVISAIELEGLEKIRITNYSRIQSNKIKQNIEAKSKVLSTPVSQKSTRSDKLEQINKSNTEIERIVTYGSENGFPDSYMSDLLEENGVEVPGAIKDGEKTTTTEIIDPDAELSMELHGVTENEDGSLEITKLGEVNSSKEESKVNSETAIAVGLKVVEGVAEFLLFKKLKYPVELPPVVVPEEEKKRNN